jgi:hypothetical protein
MDANAKEEKYYKIYVPIEVEFRKEVRMHAALKDLSPAVFLSIVIKEYLHKNPVEKEASFLNAG